MMGFFNNDNGPNPFEWAGYSIACGWLAWIGLTTPSIPSAVGWVLLAVTVLLALITTMIAAAAFSHKRQHGR